MKKAFSLVLSQLEVDDVLGILHKHLSALIRHVCCLHVPYFLRSLFRLLQSFGFLDKARLKFIIFSLVMYKSCHKNSAVLGL